MPKLSSFRHATKPWQAFLADAQAHLGPPTGKTAHTAGPDVPNAFPAQLPPARLAVSAPILPAVPRALPWERRTPTGPVAWAPSRAMAHGARDRALTDCPAGAVDFRAVHVDDPVELQRRIIWKGV